MEAMASYRCVQANGCRERGTRCGDVRTMGGATVAPASAFFGELLVFERRRNAMGLIRSERRRGGMAVEAKIREICIAEPIEQTASTMNVERNSNFAKLQAGYLFPEIGRRRREHVQKYPDAKVISRGIGDTTEPIPEVISAAMQRGCIQ